MAKAHSIVALDDKNETWFDYIGLNREEWFDPIEIEIGYWEEE